MHGKEIFIFRFDYSWPSHLLQFYYYYFCLSSLLYSGISVAHNANSSSDSSKITSCSQIGHHIRLWVCVRNTKRAETNPELIESKYKKCCPSPLNSKIILTLKSLCVHLSQITGISTCTERGIFRDNAKVAGHIKWAEHENTNHYWRLSCCEL